MPSYRGAIVSVSLLALTLAGCNKSAQDMAATSANAGLPPLPAALPMQAGPPSQLVTAPALLPVPVRRYVGVSRPASQRDAYAYLDRASDVQDEIGDAPPDYDYDNDDGVSPYVWETRGGDYRYAEPTDDGYRNYYYQPGAQYPYLVRTHDYSYAYAGGALVAVYLLSGALLPSDQYGAYQDRASRYFSRGEQLRQAANQRQHQGVNAANWAAQRPQFSAQQSSWAAARSQQPQWQAYHAQNDPSQQPAWQQERQQRQQVAQQFSGWQSHGLTGAAPAVLAVAGARAVQQAGASQPAVASQPQVARPQGLAGTEPSHHHDMPGSQGVAPVPGAAQAFAARQLAAQQARQQALANQQGLANQRLAQAASRAQQDAAVQRQAAAVRQQQLTTRNAQMLATQRSEQEAGRARQLAAAQQASAAHELAARNLAQQQQSAAREQAAARNAQQQALASQRAEQEAGRARQQAAAQQQMMANVHRQQEMAAQGQIAAREAQAHALAAQRQAQVAQGKAARPQPAAGTAPREPRHENDRHEQ